jgi:4-hydroxybenzoyl-CoA thioesterase
MSFSASMPVRVEWGDCDPAEIVFYPNYFRWFDVASWNLFEVAGGGWDSIRRRFGSVCIPLLGAESQFRSPSRVADQLIIESRVVSWERKVFKVGHRVLNDGVVAVEGSETRCWALHDRQNGGRMRGELIPAELTALFAGPTGGR